MFQENRNKVCNLAEYLEINSYLEDYKEYNNLLYGDRARVCLIIYKKYVENYLEEDLYIIPDFFNEEEEFIKNVLKNFENS
ncbi:hypothetical protein [Peptoniphilus harei]|uniref:Uncharacterized protein n=1 Tax=Peptoniphilus harei TaxID=54005 RepID=A0A943SS89_9FIRM|nr:hypothetical protein [Peptoniphilus harei]MBS6535871.1 hypothetical protein [Peptoniphilus harei]